MANNSVINGSGVGTISIDIINKNEVSNLKIEKVIYVPNLNGNLLSVSQLTSKGFVLIFKNDRCFIRKNNKLILVGHKCSHLYKINVVQSAKLSYVGSSSDLNTWHRRMGHRSIGDVKRLFSENLVDGIKITQQNFVEDCEICLKGKQARLPFPKKSMLRSKKILDLVHTDLCGPINIKTPSGNKYLLTLIDDFSRFTYVYFLRNKSQTLSKLQEYFELVKNKYPTNR